MEIGPIPGIRAVQPVQAKRTGGDLSGVFRVEFQREREESYTPHGQNAERGLEDEEADAALAEPAEAEPVRAARTPGAEDGRINMVA